MSDQTRPPTALSDAEKLQAQLKATLHQHAVDQQRIAALSELVRELEAEIKLLKVRSGHQTSGSPPGVHGIGGPSSTLGHMRSCVCISDTKPGHVTIPRPITFELPGAHTAPSDAYTHVPIIEGDGSPKIVPISFEYPGEHGVSRLIPRRADSVTETSHDNNNNKKSGTSTPRAAERSSSPKAADSGKDYTIGGRLYPGASLCGPPEYASIEDFRDIGRRYQAEPFLRLQG